MPEYEGAVRPTSIEKDTLEYELFAGRSVSIPSNMQQKLDYDDRTDTQPVYIGFAKRDLLTSADGWLLYKCTYDDSDRITAVNVEISTWDGRVAAFA